LSLAGICRQGQLGFEKGDVLQVAICLDAQGNQGNPNTETKEQDAKKQADAARWLPARLLQVTGPSFVISFSCVRNRQSTLLLLLKTLITFTILALFAAAKRRGSLQSGEADGRVRAIQLLELSQRRSLSDDDCSTPRS